MKRWSSFVIVIPIILILVLPVITLNFDSGSVITSDLVDSQLVEAGVTNGQVYLNATYSSSDLVDGGRTVIELDDGGFLIGTSINDNGIDYGLVRLDSNGNYVWNKTYGDANTNRLQSLIRCSDGGFALLGTSYNYPVPGTYMDIWLVRVNSSGSMLWNVTYGGAYNDDATGIIELDDGFIIAGTYHVTNSPDWDFWLIRTNETGGVDWSKKYGDLGTQYCHDFVQTSDDGYALCGRNESDVWLVKTDSQGNQTWNVTWGGSGYESAQDIVECELGGFGLAGSSDDSMLLLRTDSDGNHLWNETFVRTDLVSNGHSLIETRDHGFTIVGTSEESRPEFALANLNQLSMQEGSGPVWLLKTDSTGEMIWDCYLGNEGDWSNFMTNVEDGGYLITGRTSDGDIFLWVIPELDWIQTPVNQVIPTNSILAYQLEATSFAPLSWDVNSTSFLIDDDAVLRNVTSLEPGTYWLNLTVTDAVGNTLSVYISVSVTSESTTITTTTPTTPTSTGGDQTLLILAVAGIGGGVVIVFLVVIVKKRSG